MNYWMNAFVLLYQNKDTFTYAVSQETAFQLLQLEYYFIKLAENHAVTFWRFTLVKSY